MCLLARFAGGKFWAVQWGCHPVHSSLPLGGWAQHVQDDGWREDGGWMEGKWTKDGGRRMDGWMDRMEGDGDEQSLFPLSN